VKPHKFAIGQLVDFDTKFVFETRIVPTARPKGPYEVLRVLPADDLKPRVYRTKSQAEPFERSANEYEIVDYGVSASRGDDCHPVVAFSPYFTP
jgi:hypothetical protein